jgi:DNA-binding NarL/FixJ family response regulator
LIKIVIADDHPLLREGIKNIIGSSDSLCVAGEAGTVEDAIAVMDRDCADILILDLNLSAGRGIDGLARLRERFPDIPILALSMHPEEQLGVQALKAGADGYIAKNTAAAEIPKAIHCLAAGEPYISPRLTRMLLVELRKQRGGAHAPLTSRELQVVSLLGAGSKVKQVAAELSISPSSVNTYRARIFEKLKLTSNAAIVRYAIEHGLIK